jgi:AcrR family transcriptional regulator
VHAKLIAAAIELFAEQGSAVLSLPAIARRAGVAKSAAYLRWSSTEELIEEALRSTVRGIHVDDTGTVRGDLIELAHQFYGLLAGPVGPAIQRIWLERRVSDGAPLKHAATSVEEWEVQIRTILDRAVDRGDLPDTERGGYVIDIVIGVVLLQVLGGFPAWSAKSRKEQTRYFQDIVDVAMGSVDITLLGDAPGRLRKPGRVLSKHLVHD